MPQARPQPRDLRPLFICQGDFHAPPSAKQMYYFAQALAEQGYASRVLVEGDPETLAELGGAVDGLVQVGAFRLSRTGKLTRSTLAEAARFSPTLVHLYEPRHVAATAALQLAKTLGVPLFVRYADDDRFIEAIAGGQGLVSTIGKAVLKGTAYAVPSAWPFVHPRTHRELVRCAAALDAISPALAREVGRRTGRECRAILPVTRPLATGVTASSVRSEFGLPADAELVLFAGSVFRPHMDDFALLLRAFARIASDRPPALLVQTGRLAPRYRSEVSELLGRYRTRFRGLGFLPTEEDVMRLMMACDVLVQPGIPNDFNRFRLPAKLVDYLSSGRPVVCYAAGVDEILEDGRHAVLTKTGSPEELASAISRLLEDRLLAQRLGSEGRKLAESAFGGERGANDLLSYYGPYVREDGMA